MANSAVVGLLKVLLTADTASFDAEMKRVSTSMGAWSKDLATMGRQATALGTSLTKTITLPLVAMGAASVKAAIDFESSFAGVRKTVEATEPEFAAMAQQFRDLSKEIPISVNELNRLGEAAGALGIPKAEIVDFSRVMALLGVTTNVTADQAAESIAKIQNIFGSAGKDTERFASTLVALGNDGASTEQEILALATRIASAGRTIRLTQGQVLGFSAAIANVGMEAEAGGSAMSRVFIDLSQAVSAGGRELAKFAQIAGMSAEQFTKAFKEDAAGATLAFVQGLGRIQTGGGDLNKTLNELGFTELRQSDLLRRLAGDSDGLEKALTLQGKAWRENSALTEEARKRFETTESQLLLLWNRIKDVGITLGNALLPTIKSLVSVMGALLPVLDNAAKAFAVLPPSIQLLALGLAGVAAAAGPLIFVFGQMALSASALTGAFAANGLASRALNVNLGFLAVGLRANVVAAMATTTAYGAMGAASIAATGAVRALWAVMAAHPAVAVAAGIGLVTAALVKLQESRAVKQQSELVDGIKREYIARAEQAGVVLKSAQANERYLEAVTALQQLEDIRQAQWSKTIEVQKRALDAELALGRISRETYNARILAIQGEEKAADVQKRRITIAEATVAAERAIRQEIEATGYSVPQLTAAMKANEAGFNAWAKQVDLSGATMAFLKGQIKEKTAAQKVETQEVKDATAAAAALNAQLERQRGLLRELGITTRDDVTAELVRFGDAMLAAQAAGVPLVEVLKAAIPKLEALEKQARESGLDTAALTQRIRELRAEINALLGVPTLGVVPFDVKAITAGLKQISLTTVKAQHDAEELKDAYKLLGVSMQADLDKAAKDAREAYRLIASSGKATAEELKAARQKVLETERAAARETVSIWQTQIFPAVADVTKRLGEAINGSFAQMLLGAKSFKDGFIDIWNSIKAALLNIFTQILQSFVSTVLDGILAAITGRQGGIGAALGGLLGGFGKAGSVGAVVDATAGAALGGGAGGAGGAGLGAALGGAAIGTGLLGLLVWGLMNKNSRPWDELTGQQEAGNFFDAFGGQEDLERLMADQGISLDRIAELLQPLSDPDVLGIRSSFELAIQEIADAIRSTGVDISGAEFNVPHLAAGGFVSQPTLAMIGEAGPEAVIPLDAMGGIGGDIRIVFEEDGRRTAERMVRNMPGAVYRLRRWP